MKKLTAFYLFVFSSCIFFLSPLTSRADEQSYWNTFESQINGRTVSFKELITEIITTDKNINIRNVKVRWNEATDREFMDGRFLSKETPEEWLVPYWIKFENCDFDPDYWLLLRNIRFGDHLSFFHCTNIKLLLSECSFEKSFRAYSDDIDFIKFEKCDFRQGFKFNRNYVTDQIAFRHCSFTVPPQPKDEKQALDMEYRLFFVSNRVETLNLTVENSTFDLPEEIAEDPQYFINLANTNFNNLRFNNNTVNATVDLSASTVENLFMTYNCRYNRSIIVNALNINQINTKVQWESIDQGRLAVLDTGNVLYTGADAKKITDEYVANNLISCYANIYSAYRSQGSRLSANSCYVEWKDIETQYLNNIYAKAENINPFFTFLMNTFLKAFCDYGTNPLKSIIISLYVVLFFAAVYFIYPDNLKSATKKDVFSVLRMVSQNYSRPTIWTRQRIRFLIEQSTRTSLDEYVDYLKKSRGSKSSFLSSPVFRKLKLKTKLEMALLMFIRKLPPAENAGKVKAAFTWFFYHLAIFMLFVEIIVLRAAEALSLSLNVFSTLGFGNLPEKGVPRYLSIIEGFTGWFLLSIFSVALISQVIQ